MHISVTYLLKTFFWCIFLNLFQRIRNQREILRFLIPILNFCKKNFFLLLLALFSDFDCKCAGNGSKKRKIVFYECLLEFNYATIKGFAWPSCKNRCTLMYRRYAGVGRSSISQSVDSVPVLRILDILVRIRIRLRSLLFSSAATQNNFYPSFFAYYFWSYI